MRHISGVSGAAFREALGPGFGSAADAPPSKVTKVQMQSRCRTSCRWRVSRSSSRSYGLLAAIDVNKGDLLWQARTVTPDNVRNHPKLKGLTIRRPGS
jgi:hypothetical protein